MLLAVRSINWDGKRKKAMKDLVSTLLLGGALFVLAGGAIAKQGEDLHCNTSNCAFDEELGPSQTKTFIGYCDGYSNAPSNSTMVCHAVKGMTCTNAQFDNHWSCICTNWETKERHTTIDVYCKDPNQ